MRSFAAIATIATAAFTAVASALPAKAVPAPPGGGGITQFTPPRAIEIAQGGIPHAERSGMGSLSLAIPPKSHVSRHTDSYQGHSVVEIIVDLTAKVEPLCDKLTAAISGDVEVAAAVKISLQVLGEIKGLLVKATADIQAAITVGVDLLVLNGTTLAVSAVAEIVAKLVIVITTVLGLVIKVCASAKVDVLLKLCADIGIELAAIISLVVKICVGMVVVIRPLISAVVDIIIKLDMKVLIQVLALQGGYQY